MKLLIGGPSRVHRVLVGLVLASVALAGCSDSKADDSGNVGAAGPADASKSKEDAGAAGSSTTTTTAKSAKKGGSSSGKSSTPTTAKPGGSVMVNEDGPKATDENPYDKKLDIKAELAESCVRPGGSQSITIRTMPYAGVGYDTMYSDYLTGMMEGHYGGNSAGFTDENGEYRDTWVITPNAPAGEAIVLVLGSHDEGGIGETKVTYKVANALGTCS